MDAHAPPAPPPKPPGSHEASWISTPAGPLLPRPPPPPPDVIAESLNSTDSGNGIATAVASVASQQQQQQQQQHIGHSPDELEDPGEQWLPKFLQDKSKQDLAAILSNPSLLSALTHSPSTIHPSLQASHSALQTALAENVALASQLLELEARVTQQRSTTQAQLLATHALERQWRAKQSAMDHALAPFAPASLYQRLAQSVLEQEAVCKALEESFLEGEPGSGSGNGDESGVATEKEVMDWVKRYREAKKLYYLRQERKERWDEGRVGGWR